MVSAALNGRWKNRYSSASDSAGASGCVDGSVGDDGQHVVGRSSGAFTGVEPMRRYNRDQSSTFSLGIVALRSRGNRIGSNRLEQPMSIRLRHPAECQDHLHGQFGSVSTTGSGAPGSAIEQSTRPAAQVVDPPDHPWCQEARADQPPLRCPGIIIMLSLAGDRQILPPQTDVGPTVTDE